MNLPLRDIGWTVLLFVLALLALFIVQFVQQSCYAKRGHDEAKKHLSRLSVPRQQEVGVPLSNRVEEPNLAVP
jgi:ABC-type sulfate transport system substrate-binding protein